VDLGSFGGSITGRHSLDITASKDGSNQLVLTHDEYGSSATFTVQVSGSDLGLTDDQTYSGLDVEGTINGESATGSGRILTGDAPETGETSSVEGLTIKYTGTDTGDQGTVNITMGIAELFNRALFDITDSFEGYLAYKIDSLGDRISDMDLEIETAELLLGQRLERMINRFVAMEVAISRIQSMSSWLTSQINTLSSGWI
jgi:flagellar hook-associated protein 2